MASSAKTAYDEMARAHNPYGDGKATGRIVAACAEFLGGALVSAK